MDITKALKSHVLSPWLDRRYLSIKALDREKHKFKSGKLFSNLELGGFLVKERAIELLDALSKEEFQQKEADLFKFSQTNDFVSSDNDVLRNFRSFLMSDEFICLMSYLTGEKLNGTIDIGGSIYQNTDFLLPHDDRLEGRKIAYIYYLSTLNDKEGGALLLFDSKKGFPKKVAKKIKPTANTFAFFKVSPISFHQVDEVIVDKQRISINGWFHGNK